MIPLTNFAVSTHQVVTDAWQTPKNSYSIPFDRPGASSYLKPRTNCQLFQSSNVVTTTPSILELDETTASSTADLYDASSAPKDETFSLLNPVKRYYRPLVTPGFPSFSKSNVHDVALSTSGGVWQSNFLGKRVYGTSSHRPDIVRQLAKAEAKGKLLNDWPENIREILGKDSLLAVEDVNADESFFIAKKVLVDALSTRNLIQRAVPVIEGELEKVMARWDAVATTSASSKTSAITVYGRDVTSLTFNVIIHTIFGRDALSEDEVAVLREHIAHITKGLAAFPINVPILRKIPFLRRYDRALKARESLKDLMVEKIQEKRMRLEQSLVDPSISFESSGILDDFILQLYSSTASSTSSDQPQLTEERVLRFCLDNTILSIFAGFDTTASVSTNILLLLHNDPRALQLVREELSSFDITTAIPKGKVEVMDSLPALKSVLLETFRLRPAIPFSFRKTADAIVVGNTILPAGSTVQLSYSHGGLSEKLYEDPGMVCPLRFYNKITDNSSNGSSTSDDDIVKKGSVDEDEGGRPNIFGYGKHLCPGQYLAQMEIALVTKAMVCNYDFELVEGQDTSQCVPLNAPKSGLKLRLSKRE